jgi:hypothetical protein
VGIEAGALQSSNQKGSRARSPASLSVSSTLPYLLIFLHLCLTLWLSYRLNIWIDEAYSLHTTGRGLSYAFRQALSFELQPPFYFVLLNLWRRVNDSLFFARLFSVACMALTLKAVASISLRYFKGLHPAWLVALVAFNPFIIWAATQARLYALVMLLYALLFLFFFDGFLSESPKRGARALYILVSVLALYTQYYSGFLLVAAAAGLLALRRWRALRDYLLAMCVVAVCFAPMMIVAYKQASTHTDDGAGTLPLMRSFITISWRMREYLLPIQWEPLEFLRRWVLRLCALVAVVLLVRNRRRIGPPHVAVWVTTLVSALAFVGTLHFTNEGLMQLRHTAALFLPTFLSLFAVLSVIASRKLLAVVLPVALFFNMMSLSIAYKPMANTGDWERVASHIMASEKQGQAILVFHGGSALPLKHYYKGVNAVVPIPRGDTFETYDVRNYVLKDESEITAALSQAPGEHEQLWLITDGLCGFLGVDYRCDILEGYVAKYYIVSSDQNFYGSRVRLLQRKQGP